MKYSILLALFVFVVRHSGCIGSDSRANKDFFESYEGAIRFYVEDKLVNRSVVYAEVPPAQPILLECIPPKPEKGGPDAYNGLAIYQGRGDTMEKEPICENPNPSAKADCWFQENAGKLVTRVFKTGNYTCKYKQNTEPPTRPVEVMVYFKGSQAIKAYDDENKEISIPERITDEMSPRFVCPGEPNGTEVKWYRNENPMSSDHNYEINQKNFNLTFKSKEAKSLDGSRYGGWYRCERIDKEKKTVLAGYFFKIRSPAHATAIEKSYNRMERDPVSMGCLIEGEPTPVVTWERLKDGKRTPLSNDTRVKLGGYKGIADAAITINDLVADDYADYVCIAENGDGQKAEAATLLRVRSKLAALWPFLGIVAEVIILVAIIFICEKRRSKKDLEEPDDAADQKKSLTASNNESKDIRQRKA